MIFPQGHEESGITRKQWLSVELWPLLRKIGKAAHKALGSSLCSRPLETFSSGLEHRLLGSSYS